MHSHLLLMHCHLCCWLLETLAHTPLGVHQLAQWQQLQHLKAGQYLILLLLLLLVPRPAQLAQQGCQGQRLSLLRLGLRLHPQGSSFLVLLLLGQPSLGCLLLLHLVQQLHLSLGCCLVLLLLLAELRGLLVAHQVLLFLSAAVLLLLVLLQLGWDWAQFQQQ
jgi:hypothetical protein